MTRLTSLQREQIAALEGVRLHEPADRLALHEVCAGDHDGRRAGRHVRRHVARARLHEAVFARVSVSGACVSSAAECGCERDACGRRSGAGRRVRRDCDGGATAAGGGDAAGAAGPLSSRRFWNGSAWAAGAECGADGAAATRAASGQDGVFDAGDFDVGGDRRRRQLHEELRGRSDSDAVLRCAALRPVAGDGRAASRSTP